MSGYFMVRRTCIAGSTLNPVGYKILIEVLGAQWALIAEVGYVFQERHQGKSKVTSKQYVDHLHHLVRLRPALGGLTIQSAYGFPSWSVHPLWFSGSIVFVDMALLYLLSDPTTLGWP